jgi:beta-ribofuranosylaminobenzene 5'-phosphate synthase
MAVTIQAHPRLHMTLIDLGDATERKYGGAGVSLSQPVIQVIARPASRMLLSGMEQLDERGRLDAQAAIGRLARHAAIRPCELSLETLPPQHVGLGTKTSIVLSLLVALSRASDVEMDTSTLQRLSGRGGVSGIGIHGFFTGGYLVDAGHERAMSLGFAPSSARERFRVPPLITRLSVPSRWQFQLLLPPGHRIAGKAESQLFTQHTPITDDEVYQVLGHVHHGMTPAFAELDLPLLRRTLTQLHSLGFKRRELAAQAESVRQLYRSVRAVESCAVGMSSLGPLIYTVSDQDDLESRASVETICRQQNAELLATCRGDNDGYSVTDCN